MTAYKILQYLTVFFWDTPDAVQ